VDGAVSVHIFEYADYRQYLRDFYAAEKARSAAFSHRAFCRRAGLKSTNYLSLIMKGERDLSSEMAPRFARACGLSKAETDFFCDLVAYGQATTTDEKQRCHERLARYRKFREAHRLVGEQTAYHAHWYMPAVRELVALPGFVEDPARIAAMLEPAITEKQAAEALTTLCKLGLLTRDAGGKLQQTQALLTTGPGPLGHHIFVYHHAMLDLAKRALDHLPREQRDISSVTLSVSAGAVPKLRERLRQFRRELLELAELDSAPERVIQLNLQLFPLSKSAPRETRKPRSTLRNRRKESS
jgi:uncharacterized protein (TIGR02147 family)